MAIPIALMDYSDGETDESVAKMVSLTRNSPASVSYAKVFINALRNIINGANGKEEIIKIGDLVKFDVVAAVKSHNGSDPMTACYLNSSFPAALYMMYKYSTDETRDVTVAFEEGCLANANRGGENVATGSLIGALLGAECGFSNLPAKFISGLCPEQSQQIETEIDDFLDSVLGSEN
eukprot:CAMPEP_0117045790 /NCGR_PEP_ID=MMETSP0472-20121206/31679_1 /TAXON_ID=693140 ORGANISM="Tiarina fusus, Strain LIS" /NCGR_SAMPLE_ID=MMETSP0472 /ASSEMBLY_ACC=CAM_ASM_000603 /LENGTH=177 /DNA_ID=CAMNT_0004757929 /DNA_START=546 /DNA_END=1079 /DNA_ORIENTATION=+